MPSVLHVVQQCGIGGAGIACERLHSALSAVGCDSQVICDVDSGRVSRVMRDSQLWTKFVRAGRAGLERLDMPWLRGTGMLGYQISDGLADRINRGAYEIVHLHWFTQRFLPLRELVAIDKPCVWTLHDMWPATFPNRYPELRPLVATDIAFGNELVGWGKPPRALSRLKDWVQDGRVRLICVSEWQKGVIRSAEPFVDCPIHVVPNPIDTRVFTPFDRSVCRSMLGIDHDAIVLISAASPLCAGGSTRKGGDLLLGALRSSHLQAVLASKRSQLIVIGHIGSDPCVTHIGSLELRYVGQLSDPLSLAIHFSAADICIVPSRMETFGLVAAEAQACGCPTVGFDVSGLKDVICTGQTGLLVSPFDSDALADACIRLLADHGLRAGMALAARKHVEERMSFPVVASQVLAVYGQPSGVKS